MGQLDHREAERDECLEQWATERDVDLQSLDSGQQWIVFAALRFLSFAGHVAPLRRVVGYVLMHCGMELSSTVVGAVVDRTDRAVRKARQFEPNDFFRRLQAERRGHPPPKLEAEDVGPVAKFLAENPKSSVADCLAFIKQTFGVEIDRLTLRRFLKRYGLGCLREGRVVDTPLLPAGPRAAEHSP